MGVGGSPDPPYPVGLELYGKGTPTRCRVPDELRPLPAAPPCLLCSSPFPWQTFDSPFARAAAAPHRVAGADHVQSRPDRDQCRSCDHFRPVGKN
eukprot:9339937-Pyramimonas_sp.AAC.1